MIDLRTRFAGSGFLIVDSPGDTTNLVCRHGHIYADGNSLVASLDGWQDCPTDKAACRARSRALRKLGTPIMDGDFGELSVRFAPARFAEIARILKPRQAVAVRRIA